MASDGSVWMFTGLVRAVGRIRRQPNGVRIEGVEPLEPLELGDSVAVDGLCLTVARLVPGAFDADVSEETLSRSTLASKAASGAPVNLEPALRLTDRLGGHLVSGHVDGTGRVEGVQSLSQSWRLEVCWEDLSFARYVCEKASVAIDGVSLTVAGIEEGGARFWVAVIPHTWTRTTLYTVQVGDAVNLEADLMAKYAERLLDNRAMADEPPATISQSWLREQGWL